MIPVEDFILQIISQDQRMPLTPMAHESSKSTFSNHSNKGMQFLRETESGNDQQWKAVRLHDNFSSITQSNN